MNDKHVRITDERRVARLGLRGTRGSIVLLLLSIPSPSKPRQDMSLGAAPSP